ncbi:exodeoxyribonuclease VII small subunit [Catonella massiliensis]|mgnify:FL=1|jgi:exonuclease VII small subunit|uniref:Exodeoxyribonuclease 7 small subunit n=1 Tax=Catonella massiliensis TaxID=2799636 RepID=A0ABS1IXF0_9FIRM|nr:exodeoxyribonuclease VII small subunit [Catonella massiliensis]MBK5896490.1 exodeoxyribonuclease VII small subunit [Catonella massiliensis]
MAEKKNKTKENSKTIEENMARLNEINNLMSDSSIKLEESFKLYKEGVELVEKCKKQLADVEKEIVVLEEQGSANE